MVTATRTTSRAAATAKAPTPISAGKIKRDANGAPIAPKAAVAKPPKGKPAEPGSTATGRTSRGWNEHLTERWDAADTMNESNAAMPARERLAGEFVPWEAIVVDDAINPRGGSVDQDTVVRYAEILDELPPILVQKDTFKLIGGKHRLRAASEKGDFIRIVEADVPDDQLFITALADNAKHGQPLTKAQRIAAMHTLYHLDPSRSTNELARLTGCAWVTCDAYVKAQTGGDAPRPVRGKNNIVQTRKAAPPKKAPVAKKPRAASQDDADASERPQVAPTPVGNLESAVEAAGGEVATEFGPWSLYRADGTKAWKFENFDLGFAFEVESPETIESLAHLSNLIDCLRAEMRACGYAI